MVIKETKQQILKQVKQVYKKVFNESMKEVEVEVASDPRFGDLTIKCFSLGENPKEIAEKLAAEIPAAEAKGPYLNFKIDYQAFSRDVLEEILTQEQDYGRNNKGQGKRIMLEFAHPNTHKQFHIGHLKNLLTAGSLINILENAGCEVIKVNYQGDVGLHIAKCLWAIQNAEEGLEQARNKNLKAKIKFLGWGYASGAKAYQQDEKAKMAIQELNKKIYQQDESIKQLYQETRQWSLDYFDGIYKRFNITFDRLYFESEVFERGKEIVLEHPDVFKKSRGAIIFEGEKYGLHNRVFVNSEGFATYEAKDLALAELQFKEYHPDLIIHLVGPEQSDYFKVMFKALDQIMPETKGKEKHLAYGWVQLKKGKMSSRTGKIIAGKWLLEEIKKRLNDQEKVAQAALRYSMLKNGRDQNISFDIDESISLSGNSGPYLQYTYARIRSILRKAVLSIGQLNPVKKPAIPEEIKEQEKHLILKLALFPEITLTATESYEPSIIAKHLFELSQDFNNYYHRVPILRSQPEQKLFRLTLITAISIVLKKGLNLLGIEVLERM